jgi:hypothetical protein
MVLPPEAALLQQETETDFSRPRELTYIEIHEIIIGSPKSLHHLAFLTKENSFMKL